MIILIVILCIYNHLPIFHINFSLDWFHKFGCFTPAYTLFGRIMSKKKYSSHSCSGWSNYVLVITFCIICQAFQPNLSQVRIIIFFISILLGVLLLHRPLISEGLPRTCFVFKLNEILQTIFLFY